MHRSLPYALLLLACCARVAYAQNQTVDTFSDGASDGECAVDCTLREAVALAGAGGTVSFAAGLSEQTITLTAGEITLTQDVTIDGSALAVPLTVSGGDAWRVFRINGGVTATITGITITEGQAPGGDEPDHDYDGYGGALLSFGTLTLNDCTVSESEAPVDGGGIASMGLLTLNRCTVSGNTAAGYGGAVYLENDASVYGSTISGNASSQGSGIYFGGGSSLQVDNSTFSGNTVNLLVTGSAIMHETGTLTVRNSTLVGSESRILTLRAGTLNMSNTIIYQAVPNASEPCYFAQAAPDAQLGTHSNNLIYASTTSPRCEAEFTTDPNLQPLADNGGPTWTHLPGPSSEVVDNGDPATCAALPGGNFDQRGLPRVVDLDDGTYPDFDAGDPCDIGAVEAQSLAELPVELSSFTATLDGTDVVLRWQTASETNNAGFEVQRRDAEAWEALAFVAGRGTTAEPQTYSYRAGGLAPGRHVFRLKQVDYDGAFEYSPEVEVAAEVVGAYALSEVYPNPFNPQAAFTLAVGQRQHVEVGVYDALGRLVARLYGGVLEANAPHVFRLDGSGLSAGAYQVRVAGETFTATQQALLLK